MAFGQTTLSIKNELRQISERQHLIKHGFLKSYGKLEMCFICGADANLSFIITSEIARVHLNEFKRKYPCKLWTWFMNCKLITWQNFVDIHIRNSEGGTRLIQHKITGSLHKLLNLKTIRNYFAYHVVLVSTMQVLDPFQYAITTRTQMHGALNKCAQDEKHLSIFLNQAQNLPALLIYL